MPIRINPQYDLGPCGLNAKTIKLILILVLNKYSNASFEIRDGAWEFYGKLTLKVKTQNDLQTLQQTMNGNQLILQMDNIEPLDAFLKTIASRDKLDSFSVNAPARLVHEITETIQSIDDIRPTNTITLTFNRDIAEVSFSGKPDTQNEIEHLLFDLKKYLLPPTFKQLIKHGGFNQSLQLSVLSLMFPLNVNKLYDTPYCAIQIRSQPPDPMLESIKANLLSNIIWVVITFLGGVIATLIGQSLLTLFQ